ncbi:hypothetical protein [Sporosarcina sp. FA9]|uniref:hypothetical protein n=1 Tax=Sporosarcina sp. FA9 TaxID=3413030 RepID=UPI003F6598C5
MAVLGFRTSNYAVCIYVHGTQRIANIPSEYHEPVKQYAAEKYTIEYYATDDNRTKQLDTALVHGFITAVEYDETIEYMNPPLRR